MVWHVGMAFGAFLPLIKRRLKPGRQFFKRKKEALKNRLAVIEKACKPGINYRRTLR
jgi:hypothetical protein